MRYIIYDYLNSFCRTDLKFCSCSDDTTVKVWDFARCQEERSLSGNVLWRLKRMKNITFFIKVTHAPTGFWTKNRTLHPILLISGFAVMSDFISYWRHAMAQSKPLFAWDEHIWCIKRRLMVLFLSFFVYCFV